MLKNSKYLAIGIIVGYLGLYVYEFYKLSATNGENKKNN